MTNSDSASIVLPAGIFFLLFGIAIVAVTLKFWTDVDFAWKWQRKYLRHGGIKPRRTPEWEQTRKIPLGILFVVGVACFLGGAWICTQSVSASSSRALQETRFDEIEINHCSLSLLSLTNRASASRFVTIGPVRAGTAITPHTNWPGRQVSIGMDALGDGITATQQELTISGESTLEIKAGESASISLAAGSGSCSSMAALGSKTVCSKLIFGFKVTNVQGASPDLDIVRYCDL